MGDTVYVTQEKNEELCMGVANLSYGEFPKHVLQQVSVENIICSTPAIHFHK